MMHWRTRIVLALFGSCLLFAADVPAADEKEKQGSIGVQVAKEEGSDEVVIKGVFKNSPAEKAGVKVGDIILKMDGKELKDPAEGAKQIVAKKPGDKLKMLVKRDGKEKEIEITVGKRSEVLPPDVDKKPKDKE